MTKVQIEMWRKWYHSGTHADSYAGSFDELCDFALQALQPEEGTAWIITNKGTGRTIHIAKEDGWAVEVVSSSPMNKEQG